MIAISITVRYSAASTFLSRPSLEWVLATSNH